MQQPNASLICKVHISILFADMINPVNRGQNFKWDNFPEWAARSTIERVEATKLPMYYPNGRDTLEQRLIEFAQVLVNNSGVNNYKTGE